MFGTPGTSGSPFAGFEREDGSLDEELLRQNFGLGLYDDEQGLLQQQMRRAEMLRGEPGPQGQSVGGTYVAANPLEHIAYFLRQRKGDEMLEKAMADSRGLMDQQRGGSVDLLMRIAEMLRGGGGGANDLGSVRSPQEL